MQVIVVVRLTPKCCHCRSINWLQLVLMEFSPGTFDRVSRLYISSFFMFVEFVLMEFSHYFWNIVI